MRNYLFYIIVFVNFINLTAQNFVVSVPSEIPKAKVMLSDYFTKIRYLPLETNDDCLIGGFFGIDQINNILLITDMSNNKCYLFDSENGRFIREIGHVGDDPEGFQHVRKPIYNPYNEMLYFRGWNNDFIKYDLLGKFQGRIKIPSSDNSDPFASAYIAIDKHTLCVFFSNMEGREKKRLMIFTEDGEIVKIFNNYNIVETKQHVVETHDGILYKCDNQIVFKEKYVDTAYVVSTEKLIPKYIIDLGKDKVLYKDRYSHPLLSASHIGDIWENKKYLFFNYVKNNIFNMALYDKRTKKSTFAKYENGFVDDINNFLSIHIRAVSSKGSFMGFLNSSDIELEMEKENNRSNPLLKTLRNVTSEDNPVLVFIE